MDPIHPDADGGPYAVLERPVPVARAPRVAVPSMSAPGWGETPPADHGCKSPGIVQIEISGFTETLEKVRCRFCLHVLLFARLSSGSTFEIRCKHCKRKLMMVKV